MLHILSLYWPVLLLVLITALLCLLSWWIAKRSQEGTSGLLYQLVIWIIVSVGIVVMVVLLPISEETQGQVLSLLGLVLTALIALSSTSFVANAMAGVMLHATQPFVPGDYVKVNDQFGRVTRRSLFHTRIQTEWRDITTLPNLLLVNNPVTVLHRDGTVIFVEVSIGYDESYARVEDLLLEAGKTAGLTDSFVLVHELLDHAVAYRLCGFLPTMQNLLSSRSNLRKAVLEQMHNNGVEIVSPNFMNQRALDPARKFIPEQPVTPGSSKLEVVSQAPEDKIFDEAEQAAGIEDIKQKREQARLLLKGEKDALATADKEQKAAIEERIIQLEQQERRYATLVEQASGKKS